jgi:hypothetical protein
VGGYAAELHGSVRRTVDVDVDVDVSNSQDLWIGVSRDLLIAS